MTMGVAVLVPDQAGWRIEGRPGPDLARLLIGKPVAEAAALLPRLFNLCRMAQGKAARLALGLPDATSDDQAEVIRDHLAHLFVLLPRALGLASSTPPRPDDRQALFGPTGALPEDVQSLQRWRNGDGPLPQLMRQITRLFPGDLGTVPDLPLPSGLTPGAHENSPAGRQFSHPLLAGQVRSPIWRFLGRLCDLQAALEGRMPKAQRLPDGTALVQAARGTYALRLTQSEGRITGLFRMTPTDHQLAPRGALEQALHNLPVNRPDLARILVALHDPCVPVTVREGENA